MKYMYLLSMQLNATYANKYAVSSFSSETVNTRTTPWEMSLSVFLKLAKS